MWDKTPTSRKLVHKNQISNLNALFFSGKGISFCLFVFLKKISIKSANETRNSRKPLILKKVGQKVSWP